MSLRNKDVSTEENSLQDKHNLKFTNLYRKSFS
ncbi:hypothetical protein G5O_0461 [Chlamydia psittaci 6BC]|nr:hypothetical protein G5O_0461 [Chlamydia psittaci 6BC]